MSGQQHAPSTISRGKNSVTILQEAVWSTGPVWMGGKSHLGDSIPDRPAGSSAVITTELFDPQISPAFANKLPVIA